MVLQAAITTPVWGHWKGLCSSSHKSPRSLHQGIPNQPGTRSQAEWQSDSGNLPPIQQSPQQKAMTEARRILQQKRQTDPTYAALPAFFGLDDHARVHFSKPKSQDCDNVTVRRVAFMHGISTDAVQVCLELVSGNNTAHPSMILTTWQTPM